MRRFYTAVAVAPEGAAWGLTLDGRPLRTPAKQPLALSRPLAEAVAAEWSAQAEKIQPSTMPLFQLVATARDRIAADRAGTIDAIAAYGAGDLLCYRAERPAGLARRQMAAWQPLLDWSAQALDAPLAVTSGIVAVAQPPASLAALRAEVARADDLALAALLVTTAATGSLVLTLALKARRIGADEAAALAELDGRWQEEKWGEDAEAASRRTALVEELRAADRLWRLA